MNVFSRIASEARKFGTQEVAEHIMCMLGHGAGIQTKLFTRREEYYNRLSDAQMAQEIGEIYRDRMHRKLNLKDPRTFTEKIQWLKLYDNTKQKERLADKYLVRDWIAEQIGSEYLVPLIGVWEHFDEIDFENLPAAFCLKMNHGSGMNYVVKDKDRMNVGEAQKLFKAWQEFPFWAKTLEFQYRHIPRRVIAEKYIEELDSGLYDYKIHCFNGEPAFIQCIGDRDLRRHTGFQNNYDLQWNKLNWIFEDYPEFRYEVPKPKQLAKMVDCARILAREFSYVRVDLYDVNGHIYFGEMTFTPASGFYPYMQSWAAQKDRELGDLLKLPVER